MTKCPKCKGSDVIWDERTQSFVCANSNCGAEWRVKKGKVEYVKWSVGKGYIKRGV